MGVSNKPDSPVRAKRQRRLTQEHVAALAVAYSAADASRSALAQLDEAARNAVAAGVTWPDLAMALGVTKQSAHARYAMATARRRPMSSGDTLF